jgi:3-hydroxyisobutyrate dehydrogenase
MINCKVAFLGLGLIRGSMAANLARKGDWVTGGNYFSDRLCLKTAVTAGVDVVSSIEKAVAEAEIIFTCVGDVPDVREVLLGNTEVINHVLPKTLIVDMNTNEDCSCIGDS